MSVREFVDLTHASDGSVPAVAALVRVDERLVRAAIDYAADPATELLTREPDGKGVLQTAAQALAVLAGVTSLVYVAGAVVLGLRLALAHVPWASILGQLPREFVISTGAGQILIPALAVAAAYAGFRLLRGGSANVPSTARWKDNPKKLPTFGRVALVAALLLAPALLFIILQEREPVLESDLLGLHDEVWMPIVAFVVILITTVLFRELRAFVVFHYKDRWSKSAVPTAALSVIYGLAVVPALVAFWAALPLSEAKVCSTKGFEKNGYLVGQTGDAVYLGERRRFHRRLAVIPVAETAEVLIGPAASEASCELPGAQAAITAQAQAELATAGARRAAQIEAPMTLGDPELARRAGLVADSAAAVGLATFKAGTAARGTLIDEAAQARNAGDDALAAADLLRDEVARLQAAAADDDDDERRLARLSVRHTIADTSQFATTASGLASGLATRLTALARRAALDS